MNKISIVIVFFLMLNKINAQQHGRGMKFNDQAYQKTMMKAPLTRSLYGNSLPAKASLKNFAPLPKTQGQYGTCVGWSTGYCATTIVYAQMNNLKTKAEITDNAFSPLFVYRSVSTDNSCMTGTYVDEALNTIKEYGTPKFKDFSELCVTYIPPEIYPKAAQFKIKDFAKIFDLNDNNNFKIQATKKSLSEGKPVVIGMKCPPSFDSPSGCWSPTEDSNDEFGGHAMCVIGYDNNSYGGAFEVQNSWGDWWGNQGYMWIKYDDYANFTRYAFELIEDFKKKPTEEIELAGKIRYVLSDGTEMRASLAGDYYKMNQAYKSGTRFRLYISNNEPAFVYAFGSDLTGNMYQVFPHKPNISPALNYKKNDVAIPDEDHFIEMDNTTGTDFLCVLYSKDPLQFDEILRKMEQATGTFYEKVRNTLSGTLIEKSKITYNSQTTIGFNAKSADKTAVALFLEIAHIP